MQLFKVHVYQYQQFELNALNILLSYDIHYIIV